MTTRATIWLTAVVVAGLTACGGGGGGSDDGVASLDDAETENAADEGDADRPGEPEPGEVEDAFVEFTGCMREHGVDLPDDDLTITSPDPEIEAEHPGYEEAYDVCIPIVEEVTGSFEMSPEEVAEMQDDLLALAQCMRERGHDYPDPQFGDDGMVIPGEPGQLDVPAEQFQRDVNDCSADTSTPSGEGSSGDGTEEG